MYFIEKTKRLLINRPFIDTFELLYKCMISDPIVYGLYQHELVCLFSFYRHKPYSNFMPNGCMISLIKRGFLNWENQDQKKILKLTDKGERAIDEWRSIKNNQADVYLVDKCDTVLSDYERRRFEQNKEQWEQIEIKSYDDVVRGRESFLNSIGVLLCDLNIYELDYINSTFAKAYIHKEMEKQGEIKGTDSVALYLSIIDPIAEVYINQYCEEAQIISNLDDDMVSLNYKVRILYKFPFELDMMSYLFESGMCTL